MKLTRVLAGYAVAVIIAYGLAYRAWTYHAEDRSTEAVRLVPGPRDRIETIVYETPERTMVLSPRSDDAGDYVWIEERAGDGASAYKAGRVGTMAFERLIPFEVERALDAIKPSQWASFGLEEPSATLRFRRLHEPERVFDIGATVFGGDETYVRDHDGEQVYVAKSSPFLSLAPGKTSLLDPNLLGVRESELARVMLECDGRSMTATQHHADDPTARYWAAEGTDTADAGIAAWIERWLQIRVIDYVEHEPSSSGSVCEWDMTLRDGRHMHGVVREVTSDGASTRWYARTEYTRAWVELHGAMAQEWRSAVERRSP